MSYIGSSPSVQTSNAGVDYFSGNNSTTSFTLSRTVASVYQILVHVANVPQNPSTAYTVNGNVLTFTSAPPSGTNNIWVYYNSPTTQVQGITQSPVILGDATINGLTVGRGGGSGSSNTAIGYQSLQLNTIGYSLTALGYQSLYNNASSHNTAIGYQSLYTNTSGSNNTAVGDNSGFAITTGIRNTVLGSFALPAETTGQYNTVIGFQTLYNQNAGSQNTAVGYQAGYSNTTGDVTAFGYKAAYSNTTAVYNTAFGNQTLYSNTASGNTGFGSLVLYANTSGVENVGVGTSLVTSPALRLNTSGSYNVAVGAGSLSQNTTANYNTAIGYQALYGQTTLQNNVAIGYQSLYTGGNNDNVAIGYQALYTEGNTGNGQNVAIGSGASKVSLASAYNNVYIGFRSGYVCTSGGGNTLVGAQAGYSLTTANSVVAIGNSAASSLVSGSGGTYIGASVTASSSSASSEIVVGVGNGPTGKGSNTGFIQPNGGGVYQGNNSSSWSTTSDQRLKKNIVDNTVGLEAITQLRVRNFEYRTEDEVTELPKHSTINIQGQQLGVIAQEIQEILPDCVTQEDTGVLSVDPGNITWHLVNAVKQLNDLVTQQAATIANQAADISALKAKVGI